MANRSYIYAATEAEGGDRILLGQHEGSVPLIFKILLSADAEKHTEADSDTTFISGDFDGGVQRLELFFDDLGPGSGAGLNRKEFRRSAENALMVLKSKRLRNCRYIVLDSTEVVDGADTDTLLSEVRNINDTIDSDPVLVGDKASSLSELLHNQSLVAPDDEAGVRRIAEIGLTSIGAGR
ncbi:hypothetical protein JIM95_001160 [Corynebacterium sp. CCM 8835]|uniref:DUF7822 domain-containing protein n=1 Tax=Corynebacterium antarcticum TaxID=2800405 RepID=A0ABS1FKR8_9CORY|nr:hypothetical protein [Corynebacterium antarcticum]MCK7641539.1 hypothetical protein [Corynebacterium antarcticum]MCK7660363.1 hypothetical protein [Corynebacterium antarcticum]MCL0244767.1 hypothetical protein [Corynebacterium antarcticum]MCX7491140.1 hypothetical protein [Corynebacterium antarcticum]MCX7539677.1 hypothetical protein [Corynebacterium antarcticum]